MIKYMLDTNICIYIIKKKPLAVIKRFKKSKISIISFRYFIVELITAITFVLFFKRYGLRYDFFFYTVFTCNLIVATFVDIQHRIIPDEISVGGLIVGFVLSALKGITLSPFSYSAHTAIDSFLGIVIGGGIIFLFGFQKGMDVPLL